MIGEGDSVDCLFTTTDDANLTIHLRAVSDVRTVRDQLRQHVELCRDRKRVRVSEFE